MPADPVVPGDLTGVSAERCPHRGQWHSSAGSGRVHGSVAFAVPPQCHSGTCGGFGAIAASSPGVSEGWGSWGVAAGWCPCGTPWMRGQPGWLVLCPAAPLPAAVEWWPGVWDTQIVLWQGWLGQAELWEGAAVCGRLLREAGGRLRPHSHPGVSRHVLGALFGMNHPWRAPTAAVGLSPSATAQGGIPCASTAWIHEQTLSHPCWHLLAPRAGQGVGQEPGGEGDDHQLMIHVSSVSPSSTGHQADLRQLQQPRHLAPGAEAPGGSRAPRRDSGTGQGGGSRGTRSCGGCRAELPGGKTPSTAAKNP